MNNLIAVHIEGDYTWLLTAIILLVGRASVYSLPFVALADMDQST